MRIRIQFFYFIADPDPAFHVTANLDPDSDPAPHKSEANLRPQVSRTSKAPFRAFGPPLSATAAIYGYQEKNNNLVAEEDGNKEKNNNFLAEEDCNQEKITT
jgi:hypothetical protein